MTSRLLESILGHLVSTSFRFALFNPNAPLMNKESVLLVNLSRTFATSHMINRSSEDATSSCHHQERILAYSPCSDCGFLDSWSARRPFRILFIQCLFSQPFPPGVLGCASISLLIKDYIPNSDSRTAHQEIPRWLPILTRFLSIRPIDTCLTCAKNDGGSGVWVGIRQWPVL